jgi:hypothetical protein
MGNIIQDVIPFGGMNTDDDSHLFPDGDYRYAENVRNATSEEGNIGAFENILGNLKVSNTDLWTINSMEVGFGVQIPNTAIHTCIGSCIDITTNCVYYIVHTSTFELYGSEYVADSIFEYNKDTNTISTVLRDVHFAYRTYSYLFEKILNFSLDHPINGMFVVDGMLFFNDGYNPPRKINILRAKQFMQSVNNPMYFSDNYLVGGKVGFVVSPTVYNAITVGDRIQVFQDLGATHPEYDGTTTITNKIIDGTTYVIVTDKSFMTSTTPQGGYLYKSYGGYSIPFKNEFMDRIKHPPTYAPTYIYGSDSNRRINNVNKRQFQFAYKYIYRDKEESTLSPISKITNIVTSVNEITNGAIRANNVIYITLNTGSNDVKSIKIYVRCTSDTNTVNPVVVNCNNTDWWEVDEITKYDEFNPLIIDDEIEYIYKFYNSQNKQYGDQIDLNRPFDYVPLISGTSEIIENSRIVDGNITEGFENTKLDVDISIIKTPVIYESQMTQISSTFTSYSFFEDSRDHRVFITRMEIPDISDIKLNDILAFQITNTTGGNYTTELINILIDYDMLIGYPMSVKKLIVNSFNQKGYFRGGVKVWGPGNHQIGVLFSDCLISNDYMPDLYIPSLVDDSFHSIYPTCYVNTYRNGYVYDVHNLRQIYDPDDLGYTQNAQDFYINSLLSASPTYNENELIFIQRFENLFDDTTNVPDNVRNWLFSKFTLGAKVGDFYYTSQKTLKTRDSLSFGIVYSDDAGRTSFVNKIGDVDVPDYYDIPEDNTTLFVYNPTFTINNRPPSWAKYYEICCSKSNTISYFLQYYTSESFVTDGSYSKVNIGGAISAINTLYTRTVVEPYIWEKGDRLKLLSVGMGMLIDNIDYEIIKADATYVWIPQYTLTIDPQVPLLYEIYRPQKSNKEIVYYNTGIKYPIVNGFHVGSDQNQTASLPAIITTQIGNCYYIKGLDGGYRECENANDFFSCNGLDIGRPNIANVNAKQQHLFNHIRFSGQLFQNTQINNLSRNDASDYIQVSSKFGAITKLVEIGYVLKVLQEKNLNSVYLSRTQLTNTDGSTNLSAVNTPLGTINPSESLYGSKYPRSVIRNNRSLYFLDTMQGAFIKDDNNGSEQISETRKMNRFFTDLCRKIESGLYTVVMTGSYDIRHEEAILSVSLTLIASPYTVTYHTIAYSEIKNKFTTFYTYNTEQLENIGQQLISFKNGELYLHNKTTNYNEFYGVDYPQKITIVGNKNPKFNKIFTNTAIRTNGEWNVPEIRILPTLNYPIGMKSRLKKNKFVNKEGVQYASFMNDMTDPRYATPSEALINGRPLRGECVEIDYQNESTDRCVTLMFTIGMTNSELGV